MDKVVVLRNAIRTIPDFPREGILFRDVTTLVQDGRAFGLACEMLFEQAEEELPFDYVAGIESRGFVFGSVLADRSRKGFILVRKPGKLPGKVLSVEYELEYGSDVLEVHKDSIRQGASYMVVDDLLATGGTAEAACRLIESGGGVVRACLFLIELPDLGGRQKLTGRIVKSILSFEGE